MTPTNSGLAYYFSTFPSISTTFLQREVRALNQEGLKILTIANHPPPKGEVHPEDAEFRANTRYLASMHPLLFFWLMARGFASNASRFFPTLLLAIRLTDRFPLQRLVNLSHVCTAAALSSVLRKNRIRHLHVHFALGAAAVAVFHKALTGIPFTLSIHGHEVIEPRPIVEEKLKQADLIISNCAFHIQNLTRKYKTLSVSKFKIIRLGIPLHIPPWMPEPVPPVLSPLQILHIGRMAPVKAHEILLEACKILDDQHIPFHCRLIGDGPTRPEMEKMVHRRELQNHVSFLGNRFSDAVANAMNTAHVVVLCSKTEGTPMALIEAMAKGRAVIAPAITAIPEMIRHGENGFLFEGGNANQLAQCLARLAQEPDWIAEFGKAGRKMAERDYDIRRSTDALKETFDFYLQSHHG